MRKGNLLGGALIATLAATSALAGERIQIGQCSAGFTVYHVGPVMNSSNVGTAGVRMREGFVTVSDRNAFPLGTYVTLPDLDPKNPNRIYQVQNDGKDPAGRNIVVLWHDNIGLAVNLSSPPVTRMCAVKPTPDQLAANKLN